MTTQIPDIDKVNGTSMFFGMLRCRSMEKRSQVHAYATIFSITSGMWCRSSFFRYSRGISKRVPLFTCSSAATIPNSSKTADAGASNPLTIRAMG